MLVQHVTASTCTGSATLVPAIKECHEALLGKLSLQNMPDIHLKGKYPNRRTYLLFSHRSNFSEARYRSVTHSNQERSQASEWTWSKHLSLIVRCREP